MEDRLRECPFPHCLGKAESYQNGDVEGVWYGVECTMCGCAITGFNTRLQAEQAWNTRATDQLIQELENAKKAASEWKKRYEGMAILNSIKVRMIEDGDLVYIDNIPESCGCRNIDPMLEKMAEALEFVLDHVNFFSDDDREKVSKALQEYLEIKDAK